MTSQPLAPAPAPPGAAPDRVSPRLLMAVGAYATPVVATALWFLAFAVTSAGGGASHDDLVWLPFLYAISAAPAWVLAALVGTLGVALPPPHSAGRVSLVLLLPLLVAGTIETWGFLARTWVVDDTVTNAVAGTVVSVLGALLTVGSVLVMVVGLARSHVVGRWWWVAAVVVTAVVAAGQWWVDVGRYGIASSADDAASEWVPSYDDSSSAYPDPGEVPVGEPCSAAQLAALDAVHTALPWTPTGSEPEWTPTQLEGVCDGGPLTVAAPYSTVVSTLPKALRAQGISAERVESDATTSYFLGKDDAGTPVGVWVDSTGATDEVLLLVASGELS